MSQTFKNIPVKTVPAAPAEEESLYEIRKKIYPRSVSGKFAKIRILLVVFTQLLFYGAPWLHWNDRQAVLFDLGTRKFYIFGIVFWPQDFIYLALLLVISALSLFLFTAVAGRQFCGYACPQTVYTEIFLWIEHLVEGDRPKRLKLDQGPVNARKIRLKTIKHGLWVAISLWTGFTFVGYFSPIRDLGAALFQLGLGPWETFWMLFYAFATYGNAGWMREQVCKYMCPYARFQSVMFDPNTMIVTYDPHRGEPRGSRARGVDPRSKGLGDCVDCGICVQVCPTGIDIRDGLQYECISCGACIDGCNQVMDKLNYPRGLIRYATELGIQQRFSTRDMVRRVFRPRVLLYSLVVLGITVAVASSLLLRTPFKVNVMRDRAAIARELENGNVENVYRLRIMNTQEVVSTVVLEVQGMDGIKIEDGKTRFDLGPAESRQVWVKVEVPPGTGKRGSNRIEFVAHTTLAPENKIREKSSFIVP